MLVHSDLDGGAHGHLGLVLSPREYALHSNAAYNWPNHPSPPIIPAGTNLHLSKTLHDQHKECLQVFRKVQGVDQVLQQQIVTVISNPSILKGSVTPTLVLSAFMSTT